MVFAALQGFQLLIPINSQSKSQFLKLATHFKNRWFEKKKLTWYGCELFMEYKSKHGLMCIFPFNSSVLFFFLCVLFFVFLYVFVFNLLCRYSQKFLNIILFKKWMVLRWIWSSCIEESGWFRGTRTQQQYFWCFVHLTYLIYSQT